MSDPHHIYFIPGMFGFGRLAGYDYFNHVRVALGRRFADAGVAVTFDDVPCPPTSSLRFRSRIVARTVSRTASDGHGPIHLVGHSTGGLDTRLVLCPSTNLGLAPDLMHWTQRVRTAVTLNAPHYGTPLAGYFATVSGARVLYALSLLTVVSLSVGEPSLAVFSKVLATVGGVDSIFGGDLKLVSRLTDGILRFVDRSGRSEITQFLGNIRVDQGAIVQTMPEAMDLFNAAAENRPGVRYGCIAAAAPAPAALRFARRVRSPYAALTAAMYSTLYQFASDRPDPYPYARPTDEQQRLLSHGIGRLVDDTSNDGIVPTLSMLWGELLWAGEADHLDVLGHFHDDHVPANHVDWMTSGANFTRDRFSAVMDAVARFLLASANA
jgi:hypothetical protein